MQNKTWIMEFRAKRMQIGISEQDMALEAGLTEEYYRRLERENLSVPQKVRKRLKDALIRLHPEPLTLLFDYVRIRFPTMDVKHVIEDVLRLKMKYLAQEPRGMYGYTSTYRIGDVMVLTSPLEEMGVLLELRGKGCRQFEAYLDGQKRTWYEFFRKCMKEKAVFKRVDLAVNDLVGMLDIPHLISKCRKEECVSVFRSFRAFRSGGLVSRQEQDSAHMGATLYIGSMQSDLYFCLYEKAYEQLVKNGTPLEQADIQNRFEIRLKNERAYYGVRDLLTYHDAERTAFDIINRYMRFADKEVEKRRSEWKTNEKWAYFIGSDRGRLKLTTKPEPYMLTRTLNWISRQVAPTWKVLQKIDSANGTTYLKDILDHAKLTERHKKLIEQQTTSTEEMITETEE